MDRSLALLAIGLVFGGGIGFVIAAANGVTLDGHDHDGHNTASTEHAEHAGHAHGNMLSLPTGSDAPKLDITVVKDPMSGWNLHVKTENFRFAPDRASLSHVAGEGHAHVYVNGAKFARLYGPWMHIAALPEGSVKIEVALNTNDHRPFAIDDVPVSATVTITRDQ